MISVVRDYEKALPGTQRQPLARAQAGNRIREDLANELGVLRVVAVFDTLVGLYFKSVIRQPFDRVRRQTGHLFGHFRRKSR